jgi:hypothetical protein
VPLPAVEEAILGRTSAPEPAQAHGRAGEGRLKAKPISKELALELLERFKHHIPAGNKAQCWNYQGTIGKGYGKITVRCGKRKDNYLALK